MADTSESLVEVVYLGRRKVAGGKTGVAFATPDLIASNHAKTGIAEVAADLVERKASLFPCGKGDGKQSIGGLYEAKATIDPETGRIKVINLGELRFLRPLRPSEAGSEFLAAWRMADEEVGRERMMKATEAKAADNDRLGRAVAELRLQYSAIAPAYRRSFQLWLLNEIEKGKR